METTHVAIIGAGPAGLAVGACLRKAGLDFIILEKNHQVGSSWRRHYERLHLHTIKQLSSLPYAPFPKSYPRYVPRNLMIEYLDRYAADFDLQPRFGESVRSVRRNGEGWNVESVSSSISASHVVIASGLNAEPVTPTFPGIETFKGKVIHSEGYVNSKPFAGQSVLVTGMGNSGAEIALDLCEGGARPTISLRDRVHIAPRDLFGVPIQVVATLATKVLPLRANDAVFPFILDLALGNLAKHGIKRPRQGILQQVVSLGKIPVLDVGTVRQISAGAIRVAPGISAIDGDNVIFEGGSKNKYDAMIFATGYRPGYQNFLAADEVNNRRSNETRNGTVKTIHFVGFQSPVTGLLREISNEAIQIVSTIVRSRNEAARRSG
jgi:cation diffusion facilitator CzcD-associated flavoprotein CzcO